nr:hypothetical protein [uncultured Rhodopila sp.]
MTRSEAARVPAHSAIIACHVSRISGSAASALISLCQRVIQSCASPRARDTA